MADTDIKLSVDLDVKDAEKTAEQLQKEIQGIFKSKDGEMSSSLTKVAMAMKQTLGDSKSLRAGIQALKKELAELQAPDKQFSSYKQLEEQLAEIQTASAQFSKSFDAAKGKILVDVGEMQMSLAELGEQLSKMSASSPRYDELHDAYVRAIKDSRDLMIEVEGEKMTYHEAVDVQKQLNNEAASTRAQLQEMVKAAGGIENLKRVEEEQTAELAKNAERRAEINQQITEMERKLDAVNDKEKIQIIRYTELLDAEEQRARKTEEANNKVKNSNESARRSYNRVGKTATHEAREMGRAFTRRLLPAVRTVRNAVSRMNHSLTRGLQPATKNIKRLAMRFLMLSLGARSMFALLRKLRTAIVKAFDDLQKSGVSNVTKQVKELKASLATMKNALVAAFEPIISTIVPYLQRLADSLTEIIDKVAQFVAALSGRTSYIKAVKQTGDAIEETGDKADKAGKSLAGFDKLNVIDTASETKKFEEASVEEGILDSASQIKEKLDGIVKVFKDFKKQVKNIINKIKIGEWIGAGADAGELVNKILTKVIDWLNNHVPSQEDAQHLGDAIGEFIRKADLLTHAKNAINVLGKLFRSLITTAFATIESFTDDELEKMGEDFGDMIISILDNIIWALKNLPVKKIGTALNGLFSKSWEIIEKIADALRLLVRKAFSILWTTITGTELSEGAEAALGDALIGAFAAFKIGQWVTSIVGSSGLLNAFKRKDKALDRQKGKVTEEAYATDRATSSAFNWSTVLGLIPYGLGLVGGAVGALTGLLGEDEEVTDGVRVAEKKLGKQSEKLADNLQPAILAVDDLGDEAKETDKQISDLKTAVKDLSSIGANAYTLSGIQAITNVISGIETSAYNARLEIERLKGSLDGSEVPETSGETGGGKKVTTPSKTVTYSDIKKYADENNIPMTSENMSLIADYLATGKNKPKVTGAGTVTGNAKIGGIKSIGLGDIKTSTGGSGAITLNQPSDVSLDALIKAYNGDEAKAWKAYNYVMTSPTFLDTARAFENGSSEEKILRLLKEQEELGLDIDVLKWVEGKASDSQKEQTAEKVKGLFRAAGEHGTSGVTGILEMIKTFFRGFGVPLARGAVIPANKPFLAMLGDQKSGTNVEAPLDTIKQALSEVLADANMNATFQIVGDPHGMFKVIQKEATNYTKATGRLAF